MTSPVRIAAAGDLAAVEAVVAAAFAPHAERMGRRPVPMDADYRGLISAGHVHVVDGAAAILGLVVVIPEPDVLLLDTVAVTPAAQGGGVGRRLVAFAEDVARDAGLGAVRLYAHASMTRNAAWYRRLGYVETTRGMDEGPARVHMRKSFGGREVSGAGLVFP